jgi:CRP-like cAMP-binding protein
MSKIEYFDKLTNDQFHFIYYKIKYVKLDEGEMLYREGDATTCLIIVETGCLELFTYFEGNEFIFENLSQGAILNRRVLFIEDRMKVYVRAKVPTKLMVLDATFLE